MSIIMNNMMFNDHTLNIFTDASIAKFPNEYIGCAGCHVCTGFNPINNILEQPRVILRRSTNNNSEAMAVLLGIQTALKYRNNFKYINIISDSKITIFGIREWIFNWINNTSNGTMYNSSGKEVANQHILLNIIYTILNNNLQVNLYHQRGHMTLSEKDVRIAKKDFITSNGIRHDVDLELIRNIIIANDIVDTFTRNELTNVLPTNEDVILPIPLVKYIYEPFDVDKYKELIHHN